MDCIGGDTGWKQKEETRCNARIPECISSCKKIVMDNGTYLPTANINNTLAGQRGARNKSRPIVPVAFGTGCANPVIRYMIWMQLQGSWGWIEFNTSISLLSINFENL